MFWTHRQKFMAMPLNKLYTASNKKAATIKFCENVHTKQALFVFYHVYFMGLVA